MSKRYERFEIDGPIEPVRFPDERDEKIARVFGAIMRPIGAVLYAVFVIAFWAVLLYGLAHVLQDFVQWLVFDGYDPGAFLEGRGNE